MKSRAELLAEIEEKRLQDNRLTEEVNVLSIEEPDVEPGYNPYDSPGLSKELPDRADIKLRRQAAFRRRPRR